jgi:hypothetical protein
MRKTLALMCTATALAVGVGAGAAPAGAQQNGLVNVDVHNVLNNNNITVAIPIDAAANICGVSVDLLSQQLQSGPVNCTAGANQTFTVRQLQ